MHSLKFRVWDKIYKRYVKPYAVCLDGRAIVITEPSNDLETLDSKRVNIEQYTGLKDKNGQKIYEGDIVTFMVERFDSITLGFDSEQWHTAVVEWNQDDACYSFVDGDEPFSVQFEAEVIGNIHETPGLLVEVNDVD